MKVLLATASYDSAWPFIQALETELNARGIEAHVLDLAGLRLHRPQGVRHYGPRAAARLTGLKKIGTAMVLAFTLPFLRRLRGQYDAVSIHSCDHIFMYLADALRPVSAQLSAMIWGSDFYQIDDRLRERHRRIFDAAHYVVFGNPMNAADFIAWYKAYADKAVLAGFGNAKLPRIAELKELDRTALRREFDLDPDKLVVTCGYNGRRLQRHAILLDALQQVPEERRAAIQLLLPFGYGAETDYLEEVIRDAAASGIPFQVVQRRLSDEEIARLRVVSDITLTAQASDGLSHSIQEHLFAGNVVVAGEWLPYDYLVKQGCFLLTAPREGFAAAIGDAIANQAKYRKRAEANAAVIWKLSSWDSQFENWKRLFEGQPVPALPSSSA